MSKITLYVTPDGRRGTFDGAACAFPHAKKWGCEVRPRLGAQMTFENGHTLTCTSVYESNSYWRHADEIEVVYATPR